MRQEKVELEGNRTPQQNLEANYSKNTKGEMTLKLSVRRKFRKKEESGEDCFPTGLAQSYSPTI